MPITIRVHIAEKRSTHSQYENVSLGADIEAQGLELGSAEEVQRKCRELFQLARGAIQAQLLEPLPSEESAGRPRARRAGNGNGRRPSYGRPQPEPTPKQKQFLRQIATDRDLDARTIGEICERIVGKPVRSCNREEFSRLIDGLLAEAA